MFVCTECTYASRVDHCDNPACLANPSISEEHKQRLRDETTRREAWQAKQAWKERLRKAAYTPYFREKIVGYDWEDIQRAQRGGRLQTAIELRHRAPARKENQMTSTAKQRAEVVSRVCGLGVTYTDALALRRISMALHRWYELECGVDDVAVERDETTGKPFCRNVVSGSRWGIPDREAGAKRRLAKIMARYPSLAVYLQTDPRGAALYILRPGDVPEGREPAEYYTRGVVVY